jgi:hypothetical protein
VPLSCADPKLFTNGLQGPSPRAQVGHLIVADVVPANSSPASLLKTVPAQGIPYRGLPAPELPGDVG